jgi:hypothetical protein
MNKTIADAYLACLHKMLRRQAVIDQLKRDCGVTDGLGDNHNRLPSQRLLGKPTTDPR